MKKDFEKLVRNLSMNINDEELKETLAKELLRRGYGQKVDKEEIRYRIVSSKGQFFKLNHSWERNHRNQFKKGIHDTWKQLKTALNHLEDAQIQAKHQGQGEAFIEKIVVKHVVEWRESYIQAKKKEREESERKELLKLKQELGL